MPTEPTRAEMEVALQSLHRNGLLDSVPTLDDALASPMAAKLVRMHVRLAAAGVPSLTQHMTRPTVEAPEPPHPAEHVAAPEAKVRPSKPAAPSPQSRPLPAPRQANLFDPKSAAAGDRGD